MVKPGMPYLDIVRDVKQRVWLATVCCSLNYTVFAYDVNMNYEIVDVNFPCIIYMYISDNQIVEWQPTFISYTAS